MKAIPDESAGIEACARPLPRLRCCAPAAWPRRRPQDAAHAAQAKAKLAAVRARIAELTNRLGAELKQRDALSARLRDADLAITAKRQRLDELRAAETRRGAAPRRSCAPSRRARKTRCKPSAPTLAAQVRAAYMIGPQDELKLLLNQSDPASLGRTARPTTAILHEQRSAKIEYIESSETARLQQLVAQIEQQTQKLQGSGGRCEPRNRGLAARARRAQPRRLRRSTSK